MKSIKRFGELSKKQKRKLIKQKLSGKSIWWSNDGNDWLPDRIKSNVIFNHTRYYINVRPANIDWSVVADEYKYMCTDQDGATYLFIDKPVIDELSGAWYELDDVRVPICVASAFKSFVPPSKNITKLWDKIIIQRTSEVCCG